MSDYRWRRERDRYRTDEDRDQDFGRAYESRYGGSQDFRRQAGNRGYPDYGQGRDFGQSGRSQGGGRDFGSGRSDRQADYDYERSIDRSGPGDYSESLRYGRQTGFDEYPSRRDYPRTERDEWQDYARRSGGWGRHDWTRGADTYGERWAREDDRQRRNRAEDRGFFERAADEVSSWFGDEGAEHRRERDARDDGRRGLGPRGYKRSDDRIREDVCDRLTDDPMIDASEIEVTVAAAEVTLSGTVDSREERRRAEDLAERILGIGHVQNNLRVKDRRGTTGYGAGSGAGSGMGASTTASAGGMAHGGGDKPQPRKSA